MAGPVQKCTRHSYRLLLPSGMATVSVLLRVVLFSLRVVLLWGAAYYEPPFFNDCRRELPEESLPVAEESLPVAKKALPVAKEVGACARVSDGSHALGSEG